MALGYGKLVQPTEPQAWEKYIYLWTLEKDVEATPRAQLMVAADHHKLP